LPITPVETDVDREGQRIRWRCRRGLLELDLVFTRFLETRFEGLTPRERETFTALLERADTDLWDLVSGRHRSDSAAEQALLDVLGTTNVV